MTGKKILSALYENTKNVLKTMVGVKTKLLKIGPVAMESPASDYGVFFKTSGFSDCSIVMGFDLKTGQALASRLTGKDLEGNLTGESESALCELGNIVIGNTLTSLDITGTPGNMTPPSFCKGKTVRHYMPEAAAANVISLDVEVGILKIFVSSKSA